jgi:transcriptional regulator with XRE-family HTH domain
MSVGDRLEEVRSWLGLTQAQMADRIGLPLRTYTRYAKGERSPSSEALQALVRLGVNLNWLIEGQGQMSQQDGGLFPTSGQHSLPQTINPDLYGRVLEAISTVYRELGWGITLRQLGTEASRIATEIAADGLAPEDVPGAVRGAAAMLRRQLRDAQANPATGNSLKDRA